MLFAANEPPRPRKLNTGDALLLRSYSLSTSVQGMHNPVARRQEWTPRGASQLEGSQHKQIEDKTPRSGPLRIEQATAFSAVLCHKPHP